MISSLHTHTHIVYNRIHICISFLKMCAYDIILPFNIFFFENCDFSHLRKCYACTCSLACVCRKLWMYTENSSNWNVILIVVGFFCALSNFSFLFIPFLIAWQCIGFLCCSHLIRWFLPKKKTENTTTKSNAFCFEQ